jgi:thiosulfate dehydrogenase [quinone] large subunit
VGLHLAGFRDQLHEYRDGSRAAPSYGWAFSVDASKGWISSGTHHSPTGAYVDKTHGPTSFIVQKLPTGVADFGWMFALGGLGIALTLGIAMRIAGWGH